MLGSRFGAAGKAGRDRQSFASSPETRRRMQRVRRRDTPAERALRSLLHRIGLRYFVDRAPVFGVRRKADLVFPTARVAVFVDGCCWHGCPEHASWPRANAEWWRRKIGANWERDRDTDARLESAGWVVIRAWAHEDPNLVADRVVTTVAMRRPIRRPREALCS